MSKRRWTVDDIPDQRGKVALVTGANSGIGFEAARALAGRGARVVLACRDLAKAEQAAAAIRADDPVEPVETMELDLADLAAVQRFVSAFDERFDRLDILLANAGVMTPPRREETVDGFELQLGTNHLGHFALVGGLLAKVLETKRSRIVVVSSVAHKTGAIDFDDLQWQRRRYSPWRSYGQSKLANLLFAYELDRRLDRAGRETIVAAAHPGWTATNLQRHSGFFEFLNPYLAMKPQQGALPSLHAATATDVQRGDFIGPDGLGEMRGYPRRVKSNAASHDRAVAERLWHVSEELTGARYSFDA